MEVVCKRDSEIIDYIN